LPRSFDTPLPIDAVLDELARTLAGHNAAVLVAPPGAGKTTRVPLALLDEPWLKGKKIIVLEPRRIAARASAERMAHTLGERVGETSVAVTGTTIGDMVAALNTAFTGKATFALDANGQMQVTPAAGYSGYEIEVPLDTTARGTTGTSLSSLFGLGIGEKMGRARDFSLSSALQDSPQLLAFAQPTLTAATALSSVVAAPGDNRGLLALQNLLNQAHAFSPAGALSGRSVTFNDYTAAFYQEAASRGNVIETSKKAQDSRLQVATQNQSEKAGVNLDEELAKMIVLQQAYNAGGRLIQVVQQLSDELMKVMGG